MASLNKLAIRGIRSFDDKQISVIEFFSPVTVIVGHNGSGKTTIIECLKYATTGDQPPNTRGGAFVHDPKMANEKEVKAQVKLRFHAANGTRMLAVRNLSVTVKKTGMTMKTLESILALADSNADKGGKRGAISTKCAEMDAEIPHLLGVSKSVLENVIFCHQEDSYWPLAEPAALKKKFDDIFEATRYTKALDSIKALRKDRIAELKTEKERLESLSKEKSHADKLKSRISELSTTITTKQLEREETKKVYDELVTSNKNFYEHATKFREMYIKVENLEQKKQHYLQDLSSAKENVPEAEGNGLLANTGTDEELQERLRNFDDHIVQEKQRKRKEESQRQDLEDDLAKARKTHVQLINEHGELAAEAKAQERRISEREELIRKISEAHNIKGFNHTPLEREKVVEFISRLADLQKKQKMGYEKVQNETHAKNDEYNHRSRQLHTKLEGLKLQKNNTKEQISERQASIFNAEAKLDESHALASELRTLTGDVEEKKVRLEKIKSDMKNASYDERLSEKTSKTRSMEDRRDNLNAEIRALSLQADSRAMLELKKGELKSKAGDIKNTIELCKSKFRKLVGSEPQANSMERDVDRLARDKDGEHGEAESTSAIANKELQQAETNLSHAKSQAKIKRDELKGYEKRLKDELDGTDLDTAIKDAQEEINVRQEISGRNTGTSEIYEDLLKVGKARKLCSVCNRHLDDQEMAAFEKSLNDFMKKTSPEAIAANTAEIIDWEEELAGFQALVPIKASRDRLKNVELPALEKQIRDQESQLPSISEKAEEASQRLADLKKEIREIAALKQHAVNVSRNQNEIERLKSEISTLEGDLAMAGSTKTSEEVQLEFDALSADIRTNEREKQAVMTERDRQNNSLRTFEGDLHSMEMREMTLKNQIRDKDTLEERIASMKQEIITLNARSKELDSKIAEAQAPIERLDQEHQQAQSELNDKLLEAQRSSQELNVEVDKLENVNKNVERYTREKRARLLKECSDKIEDLEAEIKDLGIKIENVRDIVAKIEKEINESGTSMANLRENIRIRKLGRDIKATQAEIDLCDMEEAAKAKRTFDTIYPVQKQKETDAQSKFAHMGGEITSLEDQLQQREDDLTEFKDINKQYTNQLVKVKMSDMANNDLEKYAKALDNAIMKYHSLKMEEVNDTMRHLWNKTYQGTDIDGIKIRSDVEGGASKRSYNYRVVMTKDQVEMDMRGRCSAGQKMLASIIIRLALSDSFGQNCGILALDEPTNALDTENIDALAASLVDIINERKNHANFQLIVITHDENFLRKLGQSDVMEYYWRVSRDSRQKSVIERQRFR